MRLFDLHIGWPRQYWVELATPRDPETAAAVASRRDRLAGYLGATAAALVVCEPPEGPGPGGGWDGLEAELARAEAEFAGRWLADPADRARHQAEPADGLTWAVAAVGGLGGLVTSGDDLARLPRLFDRGVRGFRLATATAQAGALVTADAALSPLGAELIRTLAAATGDGPARAIVDLADLPALAALEALDVLESTAGRVLPLFSRGDPMAVLGASGLGRLRALGGVAGFAVGAPWFTEAGALQAAIGAALEASGGPEGLGLGTDWLALAATLPELATADALLAWLAATFDAPTAAALASGSAWALVGRAIDAPSA